MNQSSKQSRQQHSTEFYEAMPATRRLQNYWKEPVLDPDAQSKTEPNEATIKRVAITTLVGSAITLLLTMLMILIGVDTLSAPR